MSLLAEGAGLLSRLLGALPAYITTLSVGVVLLGLGMWLLLPRGSRRGRAAGVVIVAVAMGLLASRLPRLSRWDKETVLALLSGVTVVAGFGTISMRNPVYCALWFALALLGTGGLFLFTGALFIGVATVVVYAGAIVVTFLFVLMLAQPEGNAYYDRLSWEGLLSACTGAVLVFLLSLMLESSVGAPNRKAMADAAPTAAALKGNVLASDHVASLGGRLFSQYLVAVEVAGVLLLVALVGASAIVAWGRHIGVSHDSVAETEREQRP